MGALSHGLRCLVDDFESRKQHLLEAVHVEVSPFYMPVGIRRHRLDAQTDLFVDVAELEYLLAEKLIALVRQLKWANKTRSQDPLDIATMLRLHRNGIDRVKTAEYVRCGVESDGGAPVCLPAFTPELKRRTESGSARLARSDFDQACDRTREFVAELDQAIHA